MNIHVTRCKKVCGGQSSFAALIYGNMATFVAGPEGLA